VGRVMKKKELKFAVNLMLDKFERAYQDCSDLMPEDAPKHTREIFNFCGVNAVEHRALALEPLHEVLNEIRDYWEEL
jgi:hypothetical protein